MTHILFAEDEHTLGRLIKDALTREPSFSVTWVQNGKDALREFNNKQPDICVLDVMMPQMDGFTLAGELRKITEDVPILFLTARSQTEDVVKGFASGGNDYLKKPFSIEELVLRIRELVKREEKRKKATSSQVQFSIGSFEFNADTQMLRSNEHVYQLSGKETLLLRELIINKNSLLERKAALLKLWGDDNFFNARNMDVYIARLRKYLVHDPSLSIINVRGMGFKLIEQK